MNDREPPDAQGTVCSGASVEMSKRSDAEGGTSLHAADSAAAEPGCILILIGR